MSESLSVGTSTRLIADDVWMRFGQRVLFRRLALQVESGETLAVTGSNGSGKSTLLRILAGVLEPRRGRVVLEVEGQAVAAEARPLRAGMVAPYLNVYDGFTARENLAFLARARRLSQAPARIEDVLNLVGLLPRADDFVSTFSSGMRQRVKLCAALLAQPPLLLLDEPSSNLDVAGRETVRQVIGRQRERGGLVVLATNDEREVAWCDHTLDVESFR